MEKGIYMMIIRKINTFVIEIGKPQSDNSTYNAHHSKIFRTFAREMKYDTHTLPSGLRVICQQVASPVVYCGYAVKAGSRDEEPGDEGLAHFCEHVTFKGTERRRSVQILNTLERVGGDLNAFTNKEDTVYYAAILSEHLPRAVDLLTDIVFHSTYPQSEIDKEATVICEEIESYNDSPSELIYDEFDNLVFAGHPLGHHILGSVERVRQFTTADALRFTRRHYRPENCVFFASGDIDFGRLVRLLEKALPEHSLGAGSRVQGAGSRVQGAGSRVQGAGDMFSNCDSYCPDSQTPRLPDSQAPSISLAPCPPPPAPKMPPAPQTPIYVQQPRSTHQAHVMVGALAYGAHHPLRYPLFVLNNIMGGPGMNSRLNLALRERRGLVYAVESNMTAYADTGVWSTYFGCDPHDVDRCLKAVRRELARMRDVQLTPSQLAAAKRQLKGQLGVASDSRESFTLSFGRNYLHDGEERDLDVIVERIDAVSAQQIQTAAQEVFDPRREVVLCYSGGD